jgi:hypothetical protein
MLAGKAPLAHRQTGRLGSGPALGPQIHDGRVDAVQPAGT